MSKLFLEVITPDKVLVSQEVDMVNVPGINGEFGVLPGHTLFLSGIVPGELKYQTDATTTVLTVMKGFAEVAHNRVSVVVDAAETVKDIDYQRAEKALERAQTRLARKSESPQDIDFQRAEAALKRAIIRLRIADKYK
ncbi:MAG: F0F1 ATP synthase subunit epsilon [Desulfobacteraceae bacterium]|nr:MAG: F0F1 ATP synthase subunit epsilon [Desulfobacteraceae bacterium]